MAGPGWVIEGKATYQGIPCLEAKFSSTPGMSPNTGYVHVVAQGETKFKDPLGISFEDFINLNVGIDFDLSQPGQAVEYTGLTPTPEGYVPADAEFGFFGNLVFQHTRDGAEDGHIIIQRVLAVDVKTLSGDDAALVSDWMMVSRDVGLRVLRIDLADVRVLWGDRGVLFGDVNHHSAKIDPATGEREFLPTGMIDLRGQAITDPVSLKDLIEFVVVPRLPAVSGTVVWSAGALAAAKDIFPKNITWRFNNPATELSRLLKKYKLVPVLGMDGDVLYLYSEHESSAGAEEPDIQLHKERSIDPEYSFRPHVVLVAGKAKQRDVYIKFFGGDSPRIPVWWPIGGEQPENDPFYENVAVLGDIDVSRCAVGLPMLEEVLLPLEDVIESYRITMDLLRRWIFQAPEKQTKIIQTLWEDAPAPMSLDRAVEVAARLAIFAFRWYKVPDAYRRLLPMMSLPRSDGDQAPILWADTFREYEETKEQQKERKEKEKRGEITRRGWRNVNLARIDSSKYKLDKVTGLIRFDADEFFIPGRVPLGLLSMEQMHIEPGEFRMMFRCEDKGYARDPRPDPYNIIPNDHYTLSASVVGGVVTFEEMPDKIGSPPVIINAPDIEFYNEIVKLDRQEGETNPRLPNHIRKSNSLECYAAAVSTAGRYFEKELVTSTTTGTLVGFYELWPDGDFSQITFELTKESAVTKYITKSHRRSAGSQPSLAEKAALEALRDIVREQSKSVGVRPVASPVVTTVGPNSRGR